MHRTLTRVLYLLIAVGLLAGLIGAAKRYQVEQRNRRVELALDFADVRALAEMSGQPIAGVLARFQRAGITSVSLTEDTIASLEADGSLQPRGIAGTTAVTVSDQALLDRLRQAFAERVHLESPGRGPSTLFQRQGAGEGQSSLLVPLEHSSLRTLGVGIDPAALQTVIAAKLTPVARIGNWLGVSPESLTHVLSDLREQGVHTVIFTGTDVAGFRGMERETADALRQAGVNYGAVEFGKQRGDEKLSVALQGEYVRVHSIGEGEMGTLDPNEIIDRFVRAARERNIRLCYIRLPFTAGADPVETNAELIDKIARGISRNGEMRFGYARVFGETETPRWVFPLIGLGAAAGFTLLLMRLLPLGDKQAVALLIVSGLLTAGLAAAGGESGRKLAALLAALVFPTLACVTGAGRLVLGARGEDLTTERLTPNAQRPILFALKGLAIASGVTAIGIVYVVGLLATRPFMLRANQFMGIKAAHAIPIVLIGLLAIFGLPALDRPWSEEWARLKQRAAAIFAEAPRIGGLLLALAALAAFALVVARTGNEPGVGVSGAELKFRSILDKLLPVRPRTKEFLIGHPAFVLALALWARGRRRWALPLFVVGVMGQVSILNTFCHIHTPMHLSFIRDLTGLVFGALIGIAIYWLGERLLREPAPTPNA